MNSSPKNTNSQNGAFDYADQLNRYYSNKMTSQERNALEKRALEDPFLKDAMDGFDDNPGAYNQFYNRNKSKLNQKKSYTLLIALGALVALFGISTFLDSGTPTVNNPIAINDLDSVIPKEQNLIIDQDDNEYEMLSPEVETLVIIPEKELISVEEVVENQTHTEQPQIPEDDIIEIPDIDVPESDYPFVDETVHKPGQNSTETIYLYDLLVVDYRKINRENEKISYKRYDLSGLPANREGDEPSSELIETEVKVPYHNYLSKSMSFFSKSNFKPALNRYILILEQYPNDINALFYGGLSYYNLGKYDKSVLFFDKIIDSELTTFQEEALWYKAKSLLKQGNVQEAKYLLDDIISQGGFYTNDAIELKKGLN